MAFLMPLSIRKAWSFSLVALSSNRQMYVRTDLGAALAFPLSLLANVLLEGNFLAFLGVCRLW
jgi:hypothetical protein